MSLVNTSIEAARRQMVEQQVRAWDVLDPKVLDVLRRVRREAFVPAGFGELAFADAPIPLGHDEVMLPPKMDGKILQALDLKPTDAVLDVGSGTGFLAACLSRMAARVRSIEIHADLAELAARNLLAAAANNVVVEKADATQLSEAGQYDAIAVSSSLPVYDSRFEQALKSGGEAPVMEAWLVTRTGDSAWSRVALFETSIPALVNSQRPSRFVF